LNASCSTLRKGKKMEERHLEIGVAKSKPYFHSTSSLSLSLAVEAVA
jgi:hypothetical protein